MTRGNQIMKITRKLFINRRNNQASITIPIKVLKKLQEDLKVDKPIKSVSVDISLPIKKRKVKNGK